MSVLGLDRLADEADVRRPVVAQATDQGEPTAPPRAFVDPGHGQADVADIAAEPLLIGDTAQGQIAIEQGQVGKDGLVAVLSAVTRPGAAE